MLDRSVGTLVDLLRLRAQEQGDQRAFAFLTEEADIEFTYAMLDRKARALGAHLQPFVETGDRALLLYQPGMEYLVAFFGCLYAGLLAVPAYPPRLNGSMDRLQAIVADSGATVALTTSSILSKVQGRFSDTPGLSELTWVDTDGLSDEESTLWEQPQIDSHTLAFLQYTSGSTSLPKGVMLTHGNLLHNLQLIHESFGTTPESECVIWLPPYHDMGLIGGILSPLYTGFPVTLMSPFAFMQRPMLWLETISKKGASLSGGPNFAYDLCVQKITEEQKATLDLSTWKTAFTGAEPVRQETLERFVEAFAPCGFTREAFYPCYGLAEATLFVTGGHQTAAPIVGVFDGTELEEHRVTVSDTGAANVRTLVGSGHVRAEHQQVLVVDPQTMLLVAGDAVGEIWVSGPSVAQGYWRRPEQTEETFRAHLATGEGPFLRTGDLGFMREGELYITGRLKDLIIIRGRNYYPQDVEYTVQDCHVALRPGCGAAFAVDVQGEERLVIVQEVERAHRKANLDEVAQLIRQAVAAEHELQVHAVVLIKPASAPLTSSGKIQRHACRERYLNGTLDVMTSLIQSEEDGADEYGLATDAVLDADSQKVSQLDRDALLAMAEEKRPAVLEAHLLVKAAQILKIAPNKLDVQKPILHYGMDSLMAVELKNEIEAQFGIVLPLVDFLDGPSIHELTAHVLQRIVTGEGRSEQDNATHFLGNVTEFPLSYGQRSLWFLQRLAPDSAAYNIAHAVKVREELDVAALRGAFEALMERHSVLRTTFALQGDQPTQYVHAERDLHFEEQDAKAWSDDELQERLAVAAHVPFDLEKGPLLRVHLFAREEQEHVLLLTIHHIIADFWSLGVLLRDLQALYTAQKNGDVAKVTPLQTSYADHVAEQAMMLEGERGAQQAAYWLEQLRGELPVLNLPTDRPRPPVQTYVGATRSVKLGAELTNGLKQLAMQEGATLYTVLLAAFHVLLHRYTGQEDILVGSPTAGRSRAQDAAVMGYFVNPVVLRTSVAGDVTFAEFYAQVRKVVREALAHQEVPFALLVEKLQPKRDPSYSPIFQTMFVLQSNQGIGEGLAAFALNEAGVRSEGGELPLETMTLEQRAAQYDLTLFMAEVGGELVASFEYNTDLFDGTTMERMAAHFQTLLGGIVANQAATLAELPLLTAAEQEMLVAWNGNEMAFAEDACFHQLIEQQVERTPDRVAVVFEEGALTFRELNERANQVAHHLVKQGVGAGTPVGILMKRSLDMMVGLLGILKAGGAYVPLDPTHPADRLAFVLEDVQAQVLVTQSHLQHLVPAGMQVMLLDNASATLALERADNLTGRTSPDETAYILYTSGSTGKPKGVAVTHRSVVNLFVALDERMGCDSNDTWLAVSTVAFDIAVTELFWTLANGCKVVLLSEEAILQSAVASEREVDAEGDVSLAGQLVRHEATLFQCTPSLMKLLLASPRVRHAMQGLHKILLAGEAVSVTLAAEIVQGLNVRLFNGYGPTETTVYATVHEVTAFDRAIPIGKPLVNTEAYILDPHGQQVPIGVAGELHIGGVGVSRGYVNRPELTAEKFIAHPFRAEGRLYKTGDLVRYRTDGVIEYLGRIDHQVKIRGFRIELGEIETLIVQQEVVKEAVVVAHVDARGEQSLVAYVVPTQTDAVQDRQASKELTLLIRQSLQANLPPYMVPSAFVLLEAFPLTPNGKIDRKQLPAPEQEAFSAEDGFVAPRTEVEQIVAGIWAEVLQREAVGVQDHFFEMGGHSLLATQLMSRICTAFQVEIPLTKLFEQPTIAELSATIEQAKQEGQALQAPPILPLVSGGNSSPNEPVELSFAQERMWFFEQFQAGTSTYNMPGAARLQGTLHVDVLERCFHEIVARHHVLHTTFSVIDGQAVGIRQADGVNTLPLTRIDLREYPLNEREERARLLMQEEARKPFDLTTGPLVRTTLLQLAEEEHLLLVTMHHIVSDGWSIGVFIREMATLYTASVQGNDSEALLPALPIQYADYAHWQRRWLQGDVLEKQLAYWKGKLSGSLPVLQLPTDRTRPAVQTFNGATQTLTLSPTLTAQLKDLSRQEGATLYMTLLAAFQTLLHRYSHQDDIVVGSPIAGRTREEAEELIGFFVNTLVLRTDLSGEPHFRDLLARVRQVALEAYAHQDMPFEKLVEELQPVRDMGYSPLFQVMFALQNMPDEHLELPGLSLTPMTLDSGTAKFDLSLLLSETEQGLVGSLEYNTDLFDGTTITRMLGHFQTLLESIVAEPELSIARLTMLTDAERQQVLYEWNDTEADFPDDVCVHTLIEQWAEKTPDAVAVVYEGTQLTYGELNRRANQLAHYLLRRSVGQDAIVGICMQRSVEQIVALLAVLKAGGAYCPMDSTLPADRLAYMVENAGVTIVLTQERLLETFHETVQDKLVCFDGDFTLVEEESDVQPNVDSTPDDLAYVIYTSGTTGKPKGVLVPHRGIVNLMYDYQARKPLQPGDASACWGNFGFDLSAIEIYSALTFGLRLHLFPDELRADCEAYFQFLAANEIKCCYIAPFMQRPLIAWLDRGNELHLQRVEIGVEPIGEMVVAEMCRRLPTGVALLNGYGPTEVTVAALWGTFELATAQERNMPIGKPVQNMQVYLLDPYMQPVPIGVPGEIYIGGVQITRGYLGQPELTAEKFIPNPFVTGKYTRLYRTGDLGRFLADGNIDFLGRIDHQVKVRGFRIELGEIETVLAHHPSIRQTCVLAREDAPGDKTLVAYYTLQPETEVPTTAELRALLKEKLPSYMVPSALVHLDEMPLSPNKKIDRRALPAPDKSQFARETEYVAPSTETEKTLAALYSEVLKVEGVGIHDSFFDLGGHSLLATQLISRIRSTFAIELPLRELFDKPMLRELAEAVDAASLPFANEDRPKVADAIPVLDREAHRVAGEERFAYGMSFAEQRLWFLEQLTPGNSAYNIPLAVRLTGELALGALEMSLNDVVRRHETLQTTFGEINGEPVQIIDLSLQLKLHTVDLSHLPEDVRVQTVAEAMHIETKTAFDLTQGPLMRATLLRLGEEEHVLLLNMHHIISDGWSMSVFLQEMTVLYDAHLTGVPASLAPLTVQYADFSNWQRTWLEGGVLEQQLGYWREKLRGPLPVLQLPTDRPRQKMQTMNGASLHVHLPKALTERLKTLSQQEETTLFMTLLAAYKTLLFRYTGQEDILVGSPIAGRTREEIEPLIGFFVNTLVLRTELQDDLSFRELMRRVRDVAFEAYAHQDVPFEKLVEELHPVRDLSHTPFFQTMFILQNTPMSPLQLPGLSLEPLPLESTTSKFDITFSLTENENGLGGSLEYNCDLFDASTMQRFADHFHLLLESIVATPDETLGKLPLLTAGEREKMLYAWNETAQPYECQPIHHVFEQHVREVPQLPAVVYKGDSLTYAELNARANQVAHRLQQLGVKKGTLVGISMERSIEVVVAMLGALKAGGAYVMFDPSYPQDRLTFMLEDSEVPVLLTQSSVLGKWADCSAQVFCLDTEWEAFANESVDNLDVAVTPEDVAYVIYTSGTTGKPKGSLAHHRGLINFLQGLDHFEPLAQGERCCAFANLGFDVAVYEIFSALHAGCTLYFVPEEMRYDRELFFRFLQACQIHSVFILPSMMKDFSNWLRTGADTLCLHRLMIGVEPIHEQLMSEITMQLPDLHIIYGYGPSETTVACTYYLIKNGSPYDRNTPIGKPMKNVRMYLLDRHMQPVPVGVGGEIYIGGAGVAYGYLKRPELTEERFVRNPFTEDAEDRLYKTGDLARFLPDGNIEFLGRADHQVKLRGYRIELGEIEAHLQLHPAISESVVIVREDEPGEKQLVAYVVADQEKTPSISEMRQFLLASLPEYMVPALYVFLDALPLTPNGKVNRKALPKPEQNRPTLETAYVAPQSEFEHQVVAIWQELLRVERVGIHDNFFDLGGHSMLIVQVQRQIKERIGLELAVVQLFEYPTIAALAGYVQQGQASEEELIAESHQRGESRRELMKQRRQSRTNKRAVRTKGEPLDE